MGFKMPEQSTFLWVLLAVVVMLQIFTLLVLNLVLRQLRRNAGAEMVESQTIKESGPVSARSGQGFDDFLRECPQYRDATKNEQAAGYREWRRQKGINWKTSDSNS
jgi:hypothetical protein